MAEEATKSQSAPSSTSDLMASAKTVAEAAQFACTNQTDKIDKAKASEAAEDVLEAAKKYGKLDDNTGVGQYVGKAEGYLHNLHGDHAGAAAEGGENKAEPPVEGGEKKESSGGGEGGENKAEPPVEGGEKKESSGGGGGGLMDVAKGLFK